MSCTQYELLPILITALKQGNIVLGFLLIDSFCHCCLLLFSSFGEAQAWVTPCHYYFFFCWPIIYADLRGTAPLVPAFLLPAISKTHSASRPRPQRSTGGDVRSLVGCHPKETLHCCRVISVVFSSACVDSICAGHH